MKTIGSFNQLLNLPSDLAMFILLSCPWMREEWQKESMGYVFVLDNRDIHEVSSICTVPHIEENDEKYKEAITIDLETFDLWEAPAIYDDVTGYWNVVAILGQEYGCTLFLSTEFVSSIPSLAQRLNDIK